jgi:hypothetical protein
LAAVALAPYIYALHRRNDMPATTMQIIEGKLENGGVRS